MSGSKSILHFAETAYDFVAMAASLGDIQASGQVLGGLPVKFPTAFVVVQHVAPTHKSQRGRGISRRAKLPVTHTSDGGRVAPGPRRPGSAGLAPAGQCGRRAGAGQDAESALGPTVGRCAVPVRRDLLQGPRRGVGANRWGSNGAAGVRLLKQLGGLVITQDPATAEEPSIRRAAIAAGCPVLTFKSPSPSTEIEASATWWMFRRRF